MTALVVEVSALVLLLNCMKFLWKVEVERYKMRRRKPSTTPNRRRHK